jgi:hypothetical protein
MKANYGKITAGLLAAWFVISLSAAGLGVFQTNPSRPPIVFGLFVAIPIALFLAWFATSAGFRQFALSLNPRTLTYVQSWRVAGFVFLALYRYGLLPGFFALPAGWGDITIGATAAFVAIKFASPERRRSFIVWQALGMTDLVMAITLGSTASLVYPHGITTAPMTLLPMSLIPTFAVPLLFIFHIICIAQARRWNEQQRVEIGAPAPLLHSY